jgi:hypothetical protein
MVKVIPHQSELCSRRLAGEDRAMDAADGLETDIVCQQRLDSGAGYMI